MAGLKATAQTTPTAPEPSQPGNPRESATAAAKSSITLPSAASCIAGDDVTAAPATAMATGHVAPHRLARRAIDPAKAANLATANDSAVSPTDQRPVAGGSEDPPSGRRLTRST